MLVCKLLSHYCFVYKHTNARAMLELNTPSVWSTLRSICSGLLNAFQIALSKVAKRKSAHSDWPERSERGCRMHPLWPSLHTVQRINYLTSHSKFTDVTWSVSCVVRMSTELNAPIRPIITSDWTLTYINLCHTTVCISKPERVPGKFFLPRELTSLFETTNLNLTYADTGAPLYPQQCGK